MIGVVLPSIIMATVALLGFLFDRRKVKAETAEHAANANDITVGAALKLIKPMEERIERLEVRLSEMEKQVDELEEGIHELSTQLIEAGHEPRWAKP